MGYAAYANEVDRLDSVVDAIMATATGDTRAAILDLVRRQHEPDGAPAHAEHRRRPAPRNRPDRRATPA